MNRAEIEELIARYFEGINQEEFYLLQNLLKSDPVALAIYMDYAANDALLTEHFESPVAAPIRKVKARVPVRLIRKKRAKTLPWQGLLLAAAACVALAMIVWPARPIQQMASLSFREESIWYYESADGGRSSVSSNHLEKDRALHLVEGSLRAVLPSGVVAVVEGPAVLRLVSDNALRMDSGRGHFVVPPPAHGFVVTTPERRITDLGTEFGVVQLPANGSTEVHVFKGRTIVEGSGLAPRKLEAGQAVACEERGEIRDIPVAPDAFSASIPAAVEIVFVDDFEAAGLTDGALSTETATGWNRIGSGDVGVFNPPNDQWYSHPDFSDISLGNGSPGAMKGPSMAYFFNGESGSGMIREIGKIKANSEYALTFAVGHRPLRGPRGEHSRFGGYTVTLESGGMVLATSHSDKAPSAENSVGDAVLRWQSTAAFIGSPLSIRIAMNRRDYLDIDNVRLVRIPKAEFQ